jgi:hypothetical protein
MCRTKPDTDCDPFVRMNLITGDNYTGKSGIVDAIHRTAKFSAPPVKLSWMNVGLAGNLSNNRIGRKRPGHKVDLLRLAPPPATLRARKYSDLPQCCILAPVQTSVLALVLTSTRGGNSARRPPTDAYNPERGPESDQVAGGLVTFARRRHSGGRSMSGFSEKLAAEYVERD